MISVETFFNYFEPDLNSGCWLWNKGRLASGYGQAWFGGNHIQSHRLSWVVHNGGIPSGMHVCHKCDTPACVNPDHLWLGTHAANMADKKAKGRAKCSDAAREKISRTKIGTIIPPHVRQKLSAAQTEYCAKPGVKERMSQTNRDRYADPGARKKMSDVQKVRGNTLEERARRSAARKAYCSDPSVRAAISEKLKGRPVSEETRKKMAESARRWRALKREAVRDDGK